MISEIYPNSVRGKAVSLATAVNWGAAFLVTQFFLSIVDAIGEATTFFVFSALCIVTFVWAYFRVPETRGRSLEEIQELWAPNSRPEPDRQDPAMTRRTRPLPVRSRGARAVLAVDVGGSHVKMLLNGGSERRRFASGTRMTAEAMVTGVLELTEDWSYSGV